MPGGEGLRVDGLHAGYKSKPVLTGVDLDVAPAARIAVLGRNGVGKTTLVRALAGQIRSTAGRVMLDGADITSMPPHRRSLSGIALVPQGRDIFPRLTVYENLKVAALAHRSGDWESAIERVMEEFPTLAEKARVRGGSLSGGQQQILALVRALMTDPRVLLLDEPSEGIQPSTLDTIVEVLDLHCLRSGMSLVLVEQNLDFAARLAPNAFIMEKGRVTAAMDITELLDDRDLQRRYLAL